MITNTELKVIKLLIEKYTTTHDGGPYGNNYDEIRSGDLPKLVADIEAFAKETQQESERVVHKEATKGTRSVSVGEARMAKGPL